MNLQEIINKFLFFLNRYLSYEGRKNLWEILSRRKKLEGYPQIQ